MNARGRASKCEESLKLSRVSSHWGVKQRVEGGRQKWKNYRQESLHILKIKGDVIPLPVIRSCHMTSHTVVRHYRCERISFKPKKDQRTLDLVNLGRSYSLGCLGHRRCARVQQIRKERIDSGRPSAPLQRQLRGVNGS